MNVIEVEIFNKLFSSVAEEMGIILTRSAFSSNIKERRDFSCAIFDSSGDLIAQAAHIPVHLGSMPATLKHVLALHRFSPDDIIITNDPFQGGSHLPDITLIEALHDEHGNALYYLVNRAHHADVGGKNPGSMGLATTLDDEGVLITPTLFSSEKGPNTQFLNPFLEKVRNPNERMGDLRAQTAALARGKTRLQDIVSKYSQGHIASILDQLKAYGELLMRRTINDCLADGTYTFCDFLDNDGIRSRKIPIHITLSVSENEATVDFRKSADQVHTPLNTVEPVAVAATVYAFQCLMGEGYPINSGSYRPIHILTRPGSILHALPPAPVAAGNVETSQRIVDVLFGALAQAAPALIPAASCGSMNNISIAGINSRTGKDFTYYETIGGGMGARPCQDGLSGIHTHMTNTMNTPIEALEHSYPFQIEEYSIRKDSGGRGKQRGGDGIVRSYRFLDKAHVSLLTERRELTPYGLNGGENGSSGSNYLIRDGKRKKLDGKVNLDVRKDDRIVIETPGGGGWGEKD
ncbi:MAG: hydantoinase B/oxoprolinase family protein [Desulfobulbaceae bacterium]|uniref:Hydantoinase B/oxoprolinase family protein n=1 Tax=Candidatus Desulfobia pelagia TaxID=2841692 RepID=A0A8J6TEJ7_9BACT|nr:hydantoinase B/oxoprolinase family protein [Candidatus Desulfobia pelagia]